MYTHMFTGQQQPMMQRTGSSQLHLKPSDSNPSNQCELDDLCNMLEDENTPAGASK